MWLDGNFLATVAANIKCEAGESGLRLRQFVFGRHREGRIVEGITDIAVELRARPVVFPEIQCILVTLKLRLIPEMTRAVLARVLLF